mmetsp:Transcript_14727/g.21027  ORF Transcript_14727/g.21027 Transcript_14727/m.21027 type:complete len:107 (+) Transcript_14727:158-478(+)
MLPPLLKTAISGTTMTIAGTFLSCSLAIVVEKAANKTLYHFFPQLYNDVDYAFGLDLQMQREALTRSENRDDSMSTYEHYFIPDKTRFINESPVAYTSHVGEKERR